MPQVMQTHTPHNKTRPHPIENHTLCIHCFSVTSWVPVVVVHVFLSYYYRKIKTQS